MSLKNKIKRIETFRYKIKRKPQIGAWLQLPDATSSYIIAQKNFDWIAIDYEHGAISFDNLKNLITSIEVSNVLNLVRISKYNLNEIPKILDLGADGIIIANIEDVDEMQEIIKLSYFPPYGKRGLGYSRGNNFFNLKESLNITPIVIPMIENLNSFKNLSKILKFKKNIDALFLGPNDLSLSLNHKLDFGTKYKKTINEIKKIAKLSNIPVGIHHLQNKKDNLSSSIKKGFKFIAYSTDTEVINNYKLPKKI